MATLYYLALTLFQKNRERLLRRSQFSLIMWYNPVFNSCIGNKSLQPLNLSGLQRFELLK